MPALRPMMTDSMFAPTFSNTPPVMNLPPKIPIDPVSVPGCATMLGAAMAT
jgi:hypothetical protein